MSASTIQSIIISALGSFTLEKLGSSILVFIVCYIVSKILMRVLSKIIKKLPFDKTFTGFVNASIKLILYFITGIIVADALGIDPRSLIALLSVAGLAISLAIQDTLSNIANGLVILVSKPFIVGDFVEVGGVSGIVKVISLNYTKIVTYDNKVIYIPNSDISAGKIINYTDEKLRRVDINVTAAYESPMENVKKALFEAVDTIPEFHKDPKPFICTVAYRDSNIEYGVRAWTDTENYWTAYFALMDNIAVMFKKYNVEMTYNHLNVHIMEKKLIKKNLLFLKKYVFIIKIKK